MKKVMSICFVLCLILVSCSLGNDMTNEQEMDNDLSLSWNNTISDREILAIEADAIGHAHNEMLSGLFVELDKAYIEKNINRGIESHLDDDEISSIIDTFFNISNDTSRSIEVEDSTDDLLYEDEIPSELESFICRIEEIKYQENMTLDDIKHR